MCSALAAAMMAVALAAPTASDGQSPCDCRHLEALQIELRNAQRLQQAFRNKIPELRAMGPQSSLAELQRFARAEARRGLEAVPNYSGPTEVEYVAQGSLLYDPAHPKSTDTNESLCRMAASAQAALDEAKQKSACAGIGKALQAHEDIHRNSCLRRGFKSFFFMNGTERAEEEVEAYGAQIAALRAEIAKLESECDGELEYQAPITLNMPPLLVYKIVSTARISFKIDENTKKISGSGTQKLTLEQIGSGACTATSARSEYEWTVSGQEEGGFLQFKFSPKVGTTIPGIEMQCRIAGGQGYGMSLPMNFSIGDVRIEKRDGATTEIDISRISGGRASGKAITKLHLYNERSP